MTTAERLKAEDTLRAYLEGLGNDALQRVASAEKWGAWHYCYPDGRRCLLGHAEDWQFNTRTRFPVEPPGSQCGSSAGEDAFHALVEEDGLKRTAAACRHYAEHLLGTRLRALLGEEVPA